MGKGDLIYVPYKKKQMKDGHAGSGGKRRKIRNKQQNRKTTEKINQDSA